MTYFEGKGLRGGGIIVQLKVDRQPGAPPGLKKKLGFVFFVNFDCITRIYFDLSQHTMCILFTIQYIYTIQYVFYLLLLLQKHRVCVKGHKKPHRPQSSTAPVLHPPVLKFPNPPLQKIPLRRIYSYFMLDYVCK